MTQQKTAVAVAGRGDLPRLLCRTATSLERATATVAPGEIAGAVALLIVRTLARLAAEELQVCPPRLAELRRAASGTGRADLWGQLLDELHRLDPGSLFDPDGSAFLRRSRDAGVPDDVVLSFLEELSPSGVAPKIEAIGGAHETLLGTTLVRAKDGGLVLERDGARRRAGAHYTSPELALTVVGRTLRPLLAKTAWRDLVLCDPAMGGGAFLLAACRYLGDLGAEETPSCDVLSARRSVAQRCLHGVDQDPRAVEIARLSLWLLCRETGRPSDYLKDALCVADALAADDVGDECVWRDSFGAIVTRGGFDAFVGNPPWVSYAGRAAQPLAPKLRARYDKSPAFAGFKNLQALFVHRAATLLRPGGRLGFVLPTSMSDLAGYEPSRRAHDELCEPDVDLPDFEDGGFEGVFQPCMGLFSTKRAARQPLGRAGHWRLRRDVDEAAVDTMRALRARTVFPDGTFGERGYQTSRGDTPKLRKGAPTPGTVGLLSGSDIAPFHLRAPSVHADPKELSGRLRDPADWSKVAVLIRQTARFPIAVKSDGGAFRNSLLAAFASPHFTADFLVAWLNSTPVRFSHYMRHRDARQGMPQLKISHLRSLPAPDPGTIEMRAIARMGKALSGRNTGITADEQRRLDELVADALFLESPDRERIALWASEIVRPKRT